MMTNKQKTNTIEIEKAFEGHIKTLGWAPTAEAFMKFRAGFTAGARSRDAEIEQLKDHLREVCRDSYLKELGEVEMKFREAVEVIQNFQNKTEIYLKIYDGDKELRKYREDAREFLTKHHLNSEEGR